jgi:hypothetical protein
VAGVPGAAVLMATEQIAKSPQFLKVASRTMKKFGGAIENSKMPKVPSYADKAYQSSKAIRMINPTGISKNQEGQQPAMGVPKITNKLPSTSLTPSQSYSSVAQGTYPKAIKNPFVKVKKVTKGKFY